ncbi:MAG: hypothetical protein BWY74_00333 [Firmicutes bacterium ADurb.Bin419]|nr:MAG: hypothetical protein BWY74_00333 [Firmicutes bacterium ADurb.Bin419]
MEIKQLNEKINNLAVIRKQKDKIKEVIDKKRQKFEKSIDSLLQELKQQEKTIYEEQESLLNVLKENDTKSWKTDIATVTRKKTVSYKVIDESKVIEQLKKMKLDKEYVKQTITSSAKKLFEQKDFNGVDKIEKEYISVIVK